MKRMDYTNYNLAMTAVFITIELILILSGVDMIFEGMTSEGGLVLFISILTLINVNRTRIYHGGDGYGE